MKYPQEECGAFFCFVLFRLEKETPPILQTWAEVNAQVWPIISLAEQVKGDSGRSLSQQMCGWERRAAHLPGFSQFLGMPLFTSISSSQVSVHIQVKVYSNTDEKDDHKNM